MCSKIKSKRVNWNFHATRGMKDCQREMMDKSGLNLWPQEIYWNSFSIGPEKILLKIKQSHGIQSFGKVVDMKNGYKILPFYYKGYPLLNMLPSFQLL